MNVRYLSPVVRLCLLSIGLFTVHPAGAEDLVADGPALLREWVAPVYAPMITKENITATVRVRLVVDAQGQVTRVRALDGSDARFVDAALAAARQWRFSAAIEQGQPVESCLDAAVVFSPQTANRRLPAGRLPPLEEWPEAAPRTDAVGQFTPSFDYPEALEKRKLTGLVRFAGQVDAEGRIASPRILLVSHADLVAPALQTLKRWKFTPRMEGDLALPTEVVSEMTFETVLYKREEILAANDITAPDGSVPEVPPEVLLVMDPVWPVEDLLAGNGGSATVEFTVAPSGFVSDVQVVEATKPEFGQALVAAMEPWQFSRPSRDLELVSIRLRRRVEFAPAPLDAPADSADTNMRLAAALRRGEISTARGLDARIMPLYRVAPEYPHALKGEGAPDGSAEIEFVIDREGRARLPRIVKATHEAFGWAAATAVSQWLFAPPLRNGEPVDVKVRIPFNFTPPAN